MNWPGLFTTTDTAPTQVAAVAIAPGSTQVGPVDCAPAGNTPQLFAVSRPYVRVNEINPQITITGAGFGAPGPNSRVNLTGPGNQASVNSWSDRQIVVTLNLGGPGQTMLSVTANNGQQTSNGLTLQILGAGAGNVGSANNPRLRQVNPPASAVASGEVTYQTVQAALDAAATARDVEVVAVWPNAPAQDNPFGAYYENVVIHSSVRLQGVGPGGQYPDGTYVPGSVLDGRGFGIDNPSGTAWVNLVNSLPHSGPAEVPDGAVVTVLAQANQFNSSNAPAVDGFRITGGNQSDFPGNANIAAEVAGGIKTPVGAAGSLVTQGGGVYLHADAHYTAITDNIIVGNSGAYGGAVRVGTPYVNTHNDHVTVSHNQIRDNGGTNLAGGIGIFTGSNSYSVDHNAICGNFSAEYGGGVSHFGLSPGGTISANRIWLNQSYDEGGGVMVAGELPTDPTKPSAGSGAVSIDANTIEANLANDDGGGLRFLQAGNFPISVTNNMVVDNISTHEGGGLALDDSVDVRVVNNTVMGNITTATAATSTGKPAPAGLSTAANSQQLQATLPAGAKTWSDPKLFNNIFWNNRAGSWNGLYVSGIGAPDAPAGDPLNFWDMGSLDPGVTLTPTNSVLQTATGITPSATNTIGQDPQVKAPFTATVAIETSRAFPSFRQAVIVIQLVPFTQMGDYHLVGPASPANNLGTGSRVFGGVTVTAPRTDFDGQTRSASTPDAGADELP